MAFLIPNKWKLIRCLCKARLFCKVIHILYTTKKKVYYARLNLINPNHGNGVV